MQKYRKIPVEIEAVQFDGTNAAEIVKWSRGKVENVESRFLRVRTLEGGMVAQVGSWIIKGVEGEFYPCKDSVFQTTYEPVSG